MRYCKVKNTGELLETQSGDGSVEMFYSNNSSYSKEELEVGIADDAVVNGWRKEQEEARKTYADKRKAEYDVLNQFELIGEDAINGTTNHKDAILAIKAKYPKE